MMTMMMMVGFGWLIEHVIEKLTERETRSRPMMNEIITVRQRQTALPPRHVSEGTNIF